MPVGWSRKYLRGFELRVARQAVEKLVELQAARKMPEGKGLGAKPLHSGFSPLRP